MQGVHLERLNEQLLRDDLGVQPLGHRLFLLADRDKRLKALQEKESAEHAASDGNGNDGSFRHRSSSSARGHGAQQAAHGKSRLSEDLHARVVDISKRKCNKRKNWSRDEKEVALQVVEALDGCVARASKFLREEVGGCFVTVSRPQLSLWKKKRNSVHKKRGRKSTYCKELPKSSPVLPLPPEASGLPASSVT
ncbi:hypothetical protein GUITHDRAFT_103820 [Guillardia theta CCMP2712]|uniref:SAM domain-containing protein n=2 Tax=Guillardia theta TaxID=55529 RepID=L1JQX4_GUITC|nr:hypothetical protein GUITHDRAFT_103820 [Guillardia theta CCMP2712]EKX50595.1 hypothetical protein GUITHDRAFT_103820 [Guillardia theta CCMP2712]|eukprot:XP_005837575.1 hypothetical protein GUITHDRAFT_103820 [Guillardia theta CCMP2712]